jgi:hypothetical protein
LAAKIGAIKNGRRDFLVKPVNLSERLSKMLEARRLLKECGDYDSSIAGALGEVYAEERLGMEKAPKGMSAYDGTIEGRKVQVKTKECGNRKLSSRYVAISKKNRGKAEDLVVVLLDDETPGSIRHLGPVPLRSINPRDSGMQLRYMYNDIKAACDSS